MIKATLELTDGQLLEVIQFVKEKGITAVFEGALLLEVGKKYKNRKGEEVTIEGEEDIFFRGGERLYYPNGRHYLTYESELDLIEEVKEELPFEMVVGGVYEMRNGGIEEIVTKSNDDLYPYGSYQGRTYTDKGAICTSEQSQFDLIKRIR